MPQLHSVYVQVNILEVKLHIRFPCKLSFSLQSQTSTAQSKLQYELRNGHCEVGEQLQCEETVSFDGKSQYGDHQIKLLIEMKSNNGVIPAGHATFNLSKLKSLERNVYTLSLEKCPDKNATITFEVELQLIGKLENEEKINEFGFDSRSHVDSLHEMANSHIIEIANNLANTQKIPKKYPSQISNFSRDATQKEGSVVTQNQQNFAQSHVNAYGYDNRNYHTFSKNLLSPQSYAKASIYRDEQFEQLRSVRYLDKEEKSNFLRQIGKLKGQLRSMKTEDKLGQNAKLREENRAITLELDNFRERLKKCERKQRETVWSLKDTKEQLQRARAKINQVEISKKDLQIQLESKQKQCKDLQLQAKKLNEKIEDLSSKLSALQKKNEYKEASMQEQLKTLNEKYNNTESQRKKQTYELHNMLSKLEESQRRGQANLKERQRSFIEEKSKWTKNNQLLNQQIAKYKQIIQQKEMQNQTNIVTIVTLSEREANYQTTIQILQGKEKEAVLKLKQQEQLSLVKEKDIQQYKVIETQRNNFRRKNQELSQTNSQLSEKLGKITSENQRSELKIKELEASLEQCTREMQEWLMKYNKQALQLERCTKNQARLTKEVQFLSNESQTNLKKYNQLKTKYDTLEKQSQQTKTKNQERINYLSKIRQYRDNEIEELKTTISKHSSENQQLTARLKTANANILELNQQIINLEKNNRILIEDITETKRQLKQIQQKDQQYAKRLNLLNQTLKKNAQSLFEHQKQVKIQESQITILTQSHKVQITKYEERLQQKQIIIRQKEKQLSQRIQEIPNLSYQIKSSEESITVKDQLLTQRNQQIEVLLGQINSLRLELENKEKQNKQLFGQSQQLSQRVACLQQQLAKVNIYLEQSNQKYAKIKDQWSSYHTNTKNALEKVLEELARDDTTTKSNLQNFPDETLSIMQVQLVKRKNQTTMTYNAKILSLNEQKSIAEMQLVELKKRTTERQEELERLLNSNRQSSKAALAALEKQKEDFVCRIQQKDAIILQLKGQIQKRNNQLSKVRSDIQELTQELNQIKNEKQLQSNDMRDLQREITILRSQQISHQHNPQGRSHTIIAEKDIQINKLKSKIEDQEKYINELITKNQAKDKIIKNIDSQLQEKATIIDKKKLELENTSHILHKNNEQKIIQDKKYSNLQQENKELKIVIQTQKERLIMQIVKIEQLERMRTEAYNSLTASLVQNENLKANILVLESISKQNHIKIKQLQSKNCLTIQNFTKEVNQLRVKCVDLTSINELKDFQILQTQASSTSLKDELEQLKQDNEKRRNESIKLQNQIQNMKNINLYTSQTIDILTSEKNYLQEEAQNLKEKVSAYEIELEMAQEEIQKMELKNKELLLEIQKWKNELSQHERNQERLSLPMKGSISTSNFKSHSLVFSGEDKKRIRQLQRLLENKHVDVALQRKKLLRELQREKREYLNEINYLTSQVNSLRYEYKNQHDPVFIKVIQEKEYIQTKEQEQQ